VEDIQFRGEKDTTMRVPYIEFFVVIVLLLALYHAPPFRPHHEHQVIAVLFSDSGLGDVAKHVVTKALKQGLRVRAISVSSSSESLFTVASSTPVFVEYDEDLQHLSLQSVELSSANAISILREAFDGVDGIVVGAWSRQRGHRREAALGTAKIVQAASASQVSRIVMLSSSAQYYCGRTRGLSWRNVALNVIEPLFAIAFRSVINDLEAAEVILSSSGLDYAIFQPCGLDPSEIPRGLSGIQLHENGYVPPHPILRTVAKEDVADVVLAEVLLGPTAHMSTFCIGRVAVSPQVRRWLLEADDGLEAISGVPR